MDDHVLLTSKSDPADICVTPFADCCVASKVDSFKSKYLTQNAIAIFIRNELHSSDHCYYCVSCVNMAFRIVVGGTLELNILEQR